MINYESFLKQCIVIQTQKRHVNASPWPLGGCDSHFPEIRNWVRLKVSAFEMYYISEGSYKVCKASVYVHV